MAWLGSSSSPTSHPVRLCSVSRTLLIHGWCCGVVESLRTIVWLWCGFPTNQPSPPLANSLPCGPRARHPEAQSTLSLSLSPHPPGPPHTMSLYTAWGSRSRSINRFVIGKLHVSLLAPWGFPTECSQNRVQCQKSKGQFVPSSAPYMVVTRDDGALQ